MNKLPHIKNWTIIFRLINRETGKTVMVRDNGRTFGHTHTHMAHIHLSIRLWCGMYLAVQFCKQYSKTIYFISPKIERYRVEFKILSKNCVMMNVAYRHSTCRCLINQSRYILKNRSIQLDDWHDLYSLH